ncbi:MAG: prolipoprotein diacylglyceryl transferase [Clostridia bacterium]|nr:prolipoprotein diacylglyceryl transferase [Clostridia bacterium]
MLQDPIIKIDKLGIHMYGLMIGIGIVCAFVSLYLIARYKKVESRFTDFIFYNGVASIVLGFGSAALFQAFYNFIENPSAGFRIGSGMTFIGGLIGGVVCFMAIYFIFRKKFKTRLYQVVSIIPSSILIGHAFGRIGCFFGGCCYGKETDSFIGVQFPHLDAPVHPTQLYEAAFLFVMFAVCTFLVLKLDFKHNLSLYLISYGVFRFLIEYVRGDDRGDLVGFISPSQFWSIFMIAAGIGLIFLMNYFWKNAKEPVPVEGKSAKRKDEEPENIKNNEEN